jgi:tetratricopeptide (TPR) repeat protein
VTEQANSGESPSEPELRARIAAGSREATDYLELANLLANGSRFQEATSIYELGLRLDFPNVEKARFAWELGSILETRIGARADARSFAHRALSLLADECESPDVLLLRGLSQSLLAHAVWFEDAGAGAEAARAGVHWLERVIQDHALDDAVTAAYYELARLHNALGEPDKAIGFCRGYLRAELGKRERLAALMVLAEALQLAGRMPEAESATQEALRHAEDDRGTLPNLYLTLGLIQRAGNRRDEARASFEAGLRLLREQPDDWELTRTLYWHKAELHFEMGNLPEAVATLQQLLGYCPEDGIDRRRAHLWLGECHANLGRSAEARSHYEQVLISPGASSEERAAAREGLTALPS